MTPPLAADASWALSPGPLVLVTAMAVGYALRVRRVGAAPGRVALFALGLLAVLAALVSPLESLADDVFAMHMVQHVLLLDVAPVLLLLGLTKVLLRPATRRLLAIERAVGPLAHPAFAVVAYVGVMWAWHVPAFYDAALEHPLVHGAEHLLFAAVGGLYWWHLLSPIRSRHLGGMGPVVYMLSTKLLVGLLGVALAFSPEALYDFYERQGVVWGMAPLTDQHVAGLVMALEQSLVMGVALVWLFVRALSDSEREEQRAERYPTAA